MAKHRYDKTKMENDLFLEMLEVYINSILYLREVYPAAIFRRRRVYNTAAYISIFPTLNNYLFNALKTAQELKASNKLFEVELIIFQREFELFGTPEDEEIMEKYVFRVEQNENADSNSSNSIEPDLHVLQFEEELRSGLIRLEQMAKNLPRLNSECCGFRIHLETTEHAYVDIVTKDNSKSDCFPWILARKDHDESSMQAPSWQMLHGFQADSFSLLVFSAKKP